MNRLLACLLLTACAKMHQPQMAVEPQFQEYVQRFEHDSGLTIADLKVVHSDALITGGEAGYCAVSENETPTITIDQQYWDNSDDVGREVLMYHELGHCILKRSHRTDTFQAGYYTEPYSIMYPNAGQVSANEGYYTNHRSEFISELLSH